MAEGLCRHHWPERFECASAGIEKHGLNERAVRVMAEIGIDIGGHSSKTLDELGSLAFDLVITVCGHADESCPVFPGRTRVVHHGFDDPPRLALDAATEEEALAPYRRVRDEIDEFIRQLPALVQAASEPGQPDRTRPS
jgi:arsenate reductase